MDQNLGHLCKMLYCCVKVFHMLIIPRHTIMAGYYGFTFIIGASGSMLFSFLRKTTPQKQILSTSD